MTMTIHRAVLILALAVMPNAAWAEIYKYVDKDGVTRYTDNPPSQNATPIKLPPLQTYTNDSVINESSSEPETNSILAPDIVEYAAVELLTPTAEQVFNTGSNSVTAAANLSPELQAGHKLVFMIDDLPMPVPPGQTSTELTGLSRGTHSLQALVMDAANQIQAQSDAIRFHLHQPSTLQPGFDPTPGSAAKPKAGPQVPTAPGQRSRPPIVP